MTGKSKWSNPLKRTGVAVNPVWSAFENHP